MQWRLVSDWEIVGTCGINVRSPGEQYGPATDFRGHSEIPRDQHIVEQGAARYEGCLECARLKLEVPNSRMEFEGKDPGIQVISQSH